MVRMQLYVTEEIHKDLRQEARRSYVTVSEVARQRMSRPRGAVKQNVKSPKEGIMELIKLGESLDWSGTPKNLSSEIDKTLYGG